MPKIRRVHYKCSECEAEDSDKLFEHENPIPFWVCWNCHKATMMLVSEPDKRAA